MLPKGKTRRQLKARKDREEAKVIKRVRAIVAARDGYCRLYVAVPELIPFGWCGGESEWAHLEGHRRFQTRGLPAEQRHSSTGSIMLCTNHHHAYDRHRFYIHGSPKLADGPLVFTMLTGEFYFELPEPIVGAPSAGAAVGENAPGSDQEGSEPGPRSLPRSSS